MAIQQMHLLLKSVHDAHTHSYQKVTRIGVDDDDKWGSPVWENTVDDADTHASTSVDLEAAGVTLAATETATPT